MGILAEFSGPESLKAVAAELRQAGYARFEAYSPYPVHGLYEATGRRRTLLPWLVMLGGTAGCLAAILLQWWTNAVDYPYIISGKPPFSLPANVPIAFELLILFGALAAFGGVMVLCNLPEPYHPLFGCAEFRRASADAFFLSIDAADPLFDLKGTADLLRALGAASAEPYSRPQTERRVPGYVKATIALLLAAALAPPAYIAQVRFSRKSSPRLHLVLDMDFQPKYLPQQHSPLFADGRAMRPPVAGTIAAGAAIDDAHLLRGETGGQPAELFPMPVTMELMERGRREYDIFCATCHGLTGDGDGATSQVVVLEREEPKWIRPLSLHLPTVRSQPAGQLYQTIADGVRTMPSYASQIPVEDRWAIILYIRALQRSREGTLNDVPEELRKQLESIHDDATSYDDQN